MTAAYDPHADWRREDRATAHLTDSLREMKAAMESLFNGLTYDQRVAVAPLIARADQALTEIRLVTR